MIVQVGGAECLQAAGGEPYDAGAVDRIPDVGLTGLVHERRIYQSCLRGHNQNQVVAMFSAHAQERVLDCDAGAVFGSCRPVNLAGAGWGLCMAP